MTRFRIKRSRDKINRSSVEIFGPVDEDGAPLAGAHMQGLDFNQANGDVAFADLTVGNWYRTNVRFFGAKGATLTGSAKLDGATADFAEIFEFKIPADLGGDTTALGYPWSDSSLFKAKGDTA